MTPQSFRRALSAVAAIALLGGTVAAAPIAANAASTFTFYNPFAADPFDPDDDTVGAIALKGDGSTTQTALGEAPEGSTVTVFAQDTLSGTDFPLCSVTVLSADAEWDCVLTFTDPFVGAVIAVATDAGDTEIGRVSHPAIAVAAPVLDPESQAIVTNTGLGTISGTVEPLGTGVSTVVEVSIEGDRLPSCDPVAADGTWSCTYAIDGAPFGVFDVEVLQARTALGVTVVSETTATTVTYKPVGPTTRGTFLTPSTPTLRVTQPNYLLSGTAEPGVTVRVLAGSIEVCGPRTADPGGFWTCVATAPTVDGEYTLTIEQTDAWGTLGTGGSATVALTIARTPTPAPPVGSPPTGQPSGTITPLILTAPGPVVFGSVTGTLAEASQSRGIIRSIIVNSFQSFLASTDGIPFGTPVTVTVPLDLERIFAPDAGTTGSILSPNSWDAIPQRFRLSLYIFSEPRLLDSQPITGDGTVTLSGVIPDDIGVGEHELVVVVEEEGGDALETLEVRFPVTVVAPEEPEAVAIDEADDVTAASPDAGPAWIWAAVAAVGVGIIALVVVMARSARRRA